MLFIALMTVIKDAGVEIKASSQDVLNSGDLITKVNCPLENEIEIER